MRCLCDYRPWTAAAWEAADPLAGAVEPLRPIEATSVATTNSAIVAAFIRRGVSQPKWCACSQERAPVAPAIAAAAHAAHMGRL
jgi:hypothetical protein